LHSVEVALVIWYIREGELLGKESSSERRAPRKGELFVLFNSVINSTYPDVPKI
jgi:hypothetical protein